MTASSEHSSTAALKWISATLNERNIPFQICGGLAAICYGSPRPLYDIDLFVPDELFLEVVTAGSEFVSKPAMRYVEYGWDITYVQFTVHGTKVEVASAVDAKVFDKELDLWVDLNVDFSSSHIATVFGLQIPVMKKSDLVRYKKVLNRTVDGLDIKAME